MSEPQTNMKNETIKRELKYILKLQSAYDLKNKAHIETILNFNEKNKTFQSAYGLKFINRLNEIYRGSDKDLCIFCGKGHTPNGVICNDCTNKFTLALQSVSKKQATSTKADESKPKQTIITEENIKKVTEGLMGKAGNAVSIAKDKLAKEMENENVKKVTQTATREAKKASSQIMVFWKKLSKRNKILVAGATALLICFLFSGIRGASSHSSSTDLENLLGKSLRAVSKQYGTPTSYSNNGIYYSYRFSQGFEVLLNEKEKVYEIILTSGHLPLRSVTIQDNLNTATYKLQKKGYTVSDSNGHATTYKKGNDFVQVTISNGSVSRVRVLTLNQ